MNLSFYIARRYLFSKKSHNAINIISMISSCGIAIATMALVCTLSIFNGFTEIVTKSFSTFDPDLRIMPRAGKVFDPSMVSDQLKKIQGIAFVSQSLEEQALLKYRDRQETVLVKGVSPEFGEMIDLNKILREERIENEKSVLTRAGKFTLSDSAGDVQYSLIGGKLAMTLGARPQFKDPLEIYSPKRDVKINLANPYTAFSTSYVFVGGVFVVNQDSYDDQMLVVDIKQARKLFRYTKEVSSLELKLKNGYSSDALQKQIEQTIGTNYIVKNRFQQQSASYNMVNVEKWVTFLILAFILLIAVFNIVGSLSMLILEKKEDIKILRNMGATNKLISSIFMMEGWLITLFGAGVGLVMGLILCLAQEHFGLLKLGDTPGAFVVDAYPVVVQALDIVYIAFTVGLIGFLAVLYPINSLRKQL